jgi:protein-S-isoprenylcysteine O-methyltransferase Ste14
MPKMTMFGMGPRILSVSLAWALLTGLISYRWPETFCLRAIPYGVCAVVGGLMLAAAVVILSRTGPLMKRGFESGQLVTSGPFSVVRNPIYAVNIFLIIPAIAVLFRSWLMLSTALVAYLAFKWMIRVEDKYLAEKFGQDYRDYCARVNELFPWPRKRC